MSHGVSSKKFIELAGEVNTSMPEFVVHRVAEALNDERKAVKGSRVLVVGLAYKADVDDERESPSYVLMDLLEARGASVAYHDPYVPQLRLDGGTFQSVSLTAETLAQADCVVVITDHTIFDWQMIRQHARLIVDTRNALKVVPTGPARVVTL